VHQIRDAHERRDERSRRLAVDRLRRSALLDPAANHDRRPIAKCQGLVLVVGDEDRGRPGRPQDLLHVAAELRPKGGVEVREGLVKENDGRSRSECPGDRNPLLHPAGQLVRHPRGRVG
jgi:hypothetical protein